MQKKFARPALALLFLMGNAAHAQQPIGTVSMTDAEVGGILTTSGGTATIVNNGTITAHEHTATVTLARGGSVNVCATSVVHLSQSAASSGGPLLVALDRGALELKLLAGANDAVLTPDMRLQPAGPAPLDLRLRVVANGDTCVENRGSNAPALMVSDTFGESNYILHAGQHVLFEHGSLKLVVDNESSPCGCPPAAVVSVADAGVSGGTVAKPGAAVETHPFPAAVSEGLAPAPAAPAASPAHISTDMTLAYNGTAADAGGSGTAAGTGAAGTANAPQAAQTSVAAPTPAAAAQPATASVVAQAPPPPPPPTNDLAHALVRFYRWIFHRKS
jgi:hypothetical protein